MPSRRTRGEARRLSHPTVSRCDFGVRGVGALFLVAGATGGLRVKFSMIFEAQLEDATPEREHATILDCVEQAVFAEEVGFDRVWAVEHHSLVEYSHMPAPEIFLTAVAAQTSRIRVGHGA